jgi:hypothetical protein
LISVDGGLVDAVEDGVTVDEVSADVAVDEGSGRVDGCRVNVAVVEILADEVSVECGTG